MSTDSNIEMCQHIQLLGHSHYGVTELRTFEPRPMVAYADNQKDIVKLAHLNDSKVPLGAGVDRHAHIGKGEIGAKGLQKFLLHPRFNKIPVILETPKKTEEDDIKNLKRVKKLLTPLQRL